MARASLTRRASRVTAAFAVLPVLLLVASPASAHIVSTGLGPAYDSVWHFLLSPAYVAPVVGIALFAGLRGADHGRWALFTVATGWLAGELVGAAPPAGLPSSLSTAATFLIIGSLVAADLRVPLLLTALTAGVVGVLGGAMDRAAQGASIGLSGTLGVCIAVFVLSAITASLIVPLQILWLRIAVRVAGSWLAALGLLLVGWAARTK